MLGYDYWLELSVTITRNGDTGFSMFSLDRLQVLPLREFPLLLPATKFFS